MIYFLVNRVPYLEESFETYFSIFSLCLSVWMARCPAGSFRRKEASESLELENCEHPRGAGSQTLVFCRDSACALNQCPASEGSRSYRSAGLAWLLPFPSHAPSLFLCYK